MLLTLQTTASDMHTAAHPDDEHGGVLALLSRRDGVRLSLLTWNRGKSGDNAYGVPGAHRRLANILALGKTPPR